MNRPRPAKAGTATRPPWWRDWRKSTAAGAGGLLLILLGIWIVVRDKDGQEVARVRLPVSGSVTQESEKRGRGRESSSAKGSTTAKVASPKKTPTPIARESRQAPLSAWKLSPGSPPPAIAPFDAKTAKQHQAAWAKHLGVPVETSNSIGMRFVLIPPGEFDMGSTAEEVARLLEDAKTRKAEQWYIDHLPSEVPKHRVKITKPIYLGQCEVTQAEYEWVVGSNPSQLKGDATRPVENVTWDETSEFCRKLSELPKEQASRAGYRLPTEAEWEHACRAGSAATWYGSDDEAALIQQAWFTANAGGTTHPVGQKAPNAWGLHDVHGHVWEWCQDWFGDRYYATSPMDDPTGAAGGSTRVSRGGGWYDHASRCRASYRGRDLPDGRCPSLGFRLVKTVSLAPR